MVMNGMLDTLRTMLVMASERSPRCSMKMKKRNQVLMEIAFCIIVHSDTFMMRFSSVHRKLTSWFSPYLAQSIRRVV